MLRQTKTQTPGALPQQLHGGFPFALYFVTINRRFDLRASLHYPSSATELLSMPPR